MKTNWIRGPPNWANYLVYFIFPMHYNKETNMSVKLYNSILKALSDKRVDKELLLLFTRAKVFEVDFNVIPGETATLLEADKLGQRLGLPFPETMIYSDRLLVIFSQEILSNKMKYICAFESENYNTILLAGTIKVNLLEENKAKIDGNVLTQLYIVKGKLKGSKNRKDAEITKIAMSTIQDVYRTIVELNTIDRFIVEVKDISAKIRKNKPLKYYQVPKYILLHPKEIREKMHTSDELDGSKRAIHERRGHNRTYPDNKDRFPNVHGKTIWIDPCWAGSTEATVDNKHYKVILN